MTEKILLYGGLLLIGCVIVWSSTGNIAKRAPRYFQRQNWVVGPPDGSVSSDEPEPLSFTATNPFDQPLEVRVNQDEKVTLAAKGDHVDFKLIKTNLDAKGEPFVLITYTCNGQTMVYRRYRDREVPN